MELLLSIHIAKKIGKNDIKTNDKQQVTITNNTLNSALLKLYNSGLFNNVIIFSETMIFSFLQMDPIQQFSH